MNISKSKTLKSVFPLFISTILLWCWITLLYQGIMKSLPGTDAGVFSAVGMELLHGSTLYSGVFESKLPGIFLWNALAIETLDLGYVSVRYAEWFFLMLLAPLVLRMMRSLGLSHFSALMLAAWMYFLWLQRFVFGNGNQTETMAVGLLMAGVALGTSRTRFRHQLLAALLLGSSFWFREQVLVAVAAYLLWMLWPLNIKKRLQMLGVSAIPSVFIIIWMIMNGSLEAWWTNYPNYLQQYYVFAKEETSNLSTWNRWTGIVWNHFLHGQWSILIYSLLSLFMAWHPRVRHLTQNLSVVSFFLFLFHLLLTLRSGYMFGHYFQLILLEWMLLLVWIPVWMASYPLPDTFRLAFRTYELPATFIFLLMLIPVLLPGIKDYKLLLPRPYAKDVFTQYIRKNTNAAEHLYVDATEFGHYYADTGIPSGLVFPIPVFHYFSLPVFGNNPERNAEKQMAQIKKRPPKFIILGKEYSLMFHRGRGIDWFEASYEQLPMVSEYSQELRLFRLKYN